MIATLVVLTSKKFKSQLENKDHWKKEHTRVLSFRFRLGFGTVGMSVEGAWKSSSGRSPDCSISLGKVFESSGRSVVVGIMFAGKTRWLLSVRLPARRPFEPMTSDVIRELVDVCNIVHFASYVPDGSPSIRRQFPSFPSIPWCSLRSPSFDYLHRLHRLHRPHRPRRRLPSSR